MNKVTIVKMMTKGMSKVTIVTILKSIEWVTESLWGKS